MVSVIFVTFPSLQTEMGISRMNSDSLVNVTSFTLCAGSALITLRAINRAASSIVTNRSYKQRLLAMAACASTAIRNFLPVAGKV